MHVHDAVRPFNGLDHRAECGRMLRGHTDRGGDNRLGGPDACRGLGALSRHCVGTLVQDQQRKDAG